MKQGKEGWLELAPETDMSEGTREAYEAYKAAYRAMQAARERYQDCLTIQLALPADKALIFGYNFGKASIKIVNASEKPQRAQAKPQQSLAEYLAGQWADGRRG